MIIFKKLRFQNILSTGNIFTEMDLCRSQSTLIVGKNGAGKSTFIDALSFGLYGVPFRDINKPQLLSSITGKNLLVEVEFEIGKRHYMVRRGMKPSVFEIYMNDELIDQDADSRRYQEMLEKQILKMNFKTFSQIVVLGSRNFIPFMKLPAQMRRNVVEDLLDIQVFSTMNTILKKKIDVNKEALGSVETQITLAENAIKIHEQYGAATTDQHVEDQRKVIEDLIRQQVELEHEISHIETQLGELDVQKNNKKLLKAQEVSSELKYKRQSIVTEIDFFKNNDKCPTCHQGIALDFKESFIDNRETKVSDIEKTITDLQEKIKALTDIVANGQDIIQQLNSRKVIYSHREQQIKTERVKYKDLKNRANAPSVPSQTNIEQLKLDIINHKQAKEKLLKERAVLDASAGLLKDSGIKTQIIKRYIPLMNKFINSYLASMDFFINFILDENFDETIRSRFRDKFSYNSFSEGEKLRIDLALMFAWRDVSKARNSAATNLLILDEVLDSSLDTEGADDFIKILKHLSQNTNLFLISHKGESLYDKFHSVIAFEKHSNFSRIAGSR